MERLKAQAAELQAQALTADTQSLKTLCEKVESERDSLRAELAQARGALVELAKYQFHELADVSLETRSLMCKCYDAALAATKGA